MLCACLKVLCLSKQQLFYTYLELDTDIDVVICCVELVVIVFKFSTYELFDMDNDVYYDMDNDVYYDM